MKTAEQILAIAEKKSNTRLGQVRIINRMFRRQDGSDRWPLNGRFNATERAIRRLRGVCDCPYSHALSLEREISNIVNDEKNW